MTDYAKLRELAQQATPGPWCTDEDDFPGDDHLGLYARGGQTTLLHQVSGDAVMDKYDADFVAAANPQTVLALLDELEALRLGQGRAPAPAGPGDGAFHGSHPIPDSTSGAP